MELQISTSGSDEESNRIFGYFSFRFNDVHGDGHSNYRFVIHLDFDSESQVGLMKELIEGENDDFEELMYDMESEYGIHDYGAYQKDFFGYHSDAIETDKHLEVMNKWKSFFEKKGFHCGSIDLVSDEQVERENLEYPFGDTWDFPLNIKDQNGRGAPNYSDIDLSKGF